VSGVLLRPARDSDARPAGGTPGRVLVISGSVGAGHDGAARELADRLRRAGTDVDVRDFLDAVPPWVAWLLREGYLATSRRCPSAFEAMFRAAERGWLPLHLFRLAAHLGSDEVTRWLRAGAYDTAVSTYPVASQCLGQLRGRGACTVPAITYVTDPAVHRAWVHPGVDVHLTVTRASADQAARDHPVPITDAGPLVPQRFSAAARVARGELRRQLSLPEDRPVALISAGSQGLGDVRRSAVDVAAVGALPLVLCGRNARLVRQLQSVPGAIALGWRTDVPDLMRAADVLVHNAGGLTFTEALVTGLPAVTYRPIPGHGRANAVALHASGLAPWAQNREELGTMIRKQISAGAPRAPQGDPASAVLGAFASRGRVAGAAS
jgi:processive 1,2-diacylglycerol beta-glucosyltransferase